MKEIELPLIDLLIGFYIFYIDGGDDEQLKQLAGFINGNYITVGPLVAPNTLGAISTLVSFYVNIPQMPRPTKEAAQGIIAELIKRRAELLAVSQVSVSLNEGKSTSISTDDNSILLGIRPDKDWFRKVDAVFDLTGLYDLTDEYSGIKNYNTYETWVELEDVVSTKVTGCWCSLFFGNRKLSVLIQKTGDYQAIVESLLRAFPFLKPTPSFEFAFDSDCYGKKNEDGYKGFGAAHHIKLFNND